MTCPDCKGTGKYTGFTTVEACTACGGSGLLQIIVPPTGVKDWNKPYDGPLGFDDFIIEPVEQHWVLKVWERWAKSKNLIK